MQMDTFHQSYQPLNIFAFIEIILLLKSRSHSLQLKFLQVHVDKLVK